MERILVSEMMTVDVRSIGPSVSLEEAVLLMRDARISCVVVVEARRPVGMLSERDIVLVMAEELGRRPRPRVVREVMSTPVRTIEASATIEEAMDRCGESRVRRLVVVDEEGRISGLVTQSDLLRVHDQALQRERRLLESRVRERTRALEEATRRLERLALMDPLLEIGNRRAMVVELERVHHRARRHGRPYTVALLDIDWFSNYNEIYGRSAGDRLLVDVSARLSGRLRNVDALFRYGGEEFLAILADTSLEESIIAAERLRRHVFGARIEHEGSPLGVVSTSCGVSGVDPADLPESWVAIVENADAALRRAKAAGKNRVDAASRRAEDAA